MTYLHLLFPPSYQSSQAGPLTEHTVWDLQVTRDRELRAFQCTEGVSVSSAFGTGYPAGEASLSYHLCCKGDGFTFPSVGTSVHSLFGGTGEDQLCKIVTSKKSPRNSSDFDMEGLPLFIYILNSTVTTMITIAFLIREYCQ